MSDAPGIPPPLPAIDTERVAAMGIRQLSGRHLTLFTDLPPGEGVDALPRVFDLAIPQWCDYFDIAPQRAESWQMHAYVMNDRTRFERAGLLPENLPPFLHGYQRGAEMWVYEQPSEYYRRHLVLHEGTHAFMQWSLGGAGPPWYMEGLAELLSTHLWRDGTLTLRHFPRSKDEVPHWGRIKIIQDELEAQRGRSLGDILQYGTAAHLHVEPYAWCWAAAVFLESHPDYRARFHALQRQAGETSLEFSRRFRRELDADWTWLAHQWQSFIYAIDYGYELRREAIRRRPARPLPADGLTIQVAADRGWQSTGIELETGASYDVQASGRYQVGDQPRPWRCEPNGVTLRYHQGMPLGLLLGAIVREAELPGETTPLAVPDPIGFGGTSEVRRGGVLYLRINDSPAALEDNAGQVTVRIRKR